MASTDVSGNTVELVKMTITAFDDEKYENPSPDGEFVVMYNPNTYTQEFKNFYEKAPTQGNKETLTFKHTESESIDFEYLFDATGASISGKSNMADDIIKDGRTDKVIDRFLEITYKVNGETHQPRFLRLQWGDFTFEGLLEKAVVTHKLFDQSGYPIRSTVNCTFRTHQSLEEQAAEARKNSPDLTRYRTVRTDDTLPVLGFQFYENPDFYLELARVNNLNNFRRLKAGQRIVLPPVNKTS
ncbi:MAG: hypothetical protein AAGA85_10820 [Bacteroidota bacterium]